MRLFGIGEPTMVQKSKEVNKVLKELGLHPSTESGKQIRAAIGLELLGEQYSTMEKYNKAAFVKENHEVLGHVRDMLQQEGILSKPKQVTRK